MCSATGVCIDVCACVLLLVCVLDVCMCSVTGVGFTSGVVSVLDALTLEDVCEPFHYARDCITHIAFSHDSSYMATAVSKPLRTVEHEVHILSSSPHRILTCV